jgi:N-acetyl-beta-hexosaminidase
VPNRARLDYQVFPRLCAMAETGWTPRDRKDLTDFRRRLELFQKWLDQLGVNHAHLKDVEPSKWKQRFGVFTIIHPQSKMAERTS